MLSLRDRPERAPTGKLGSGHEQPTHAPLPACSNIQGTDRVTLGLAIGGTVANPSVKLTTGSVKGQAANIAKDVTKSLVTKAVQDKLGVNVSGLIPGSGHKVNTDSIRRATEAQAAIKAKQEAARLRADAEKKATEKLSQGLNNLFGKPKPKAPVDTAGK